MKVIDDSPGVQGRQLRRTVVEGRDMKCYTVVTRQLYERQPPPEFPNFETVVQQAPLKGGWKELIVPLQRRFHARDDAVAFHGSVIGDFDAMLKIPEPPPKKPEHPPKPAAVPAPAAGQKSVEAKPQGSPPAGNSSL